jgi:hypothetical protein
MRATLWLIAGFFLVVACSGPAEVKPGNSNLTPLVYLTVIDSPGDVSADFSKGDEKMFDVTGEAIDLTSVQVEAYPGTLAVSFTMAETPAYRVPTTFGPESSVDQVYSYFVYLETDGDGVFDYRLMATNNYDTGKWEGEFYSVRGELMGGKDFPGTVSAHGNVIDLYLNDPLLSILGEKWAICPGSELAYNSVFNIIPNGAELADYSGWATYTDAVQGSKEAPKCLEGFLAPIVIKRSEISPN